MNGLDLTQFVWAIPLLLAVLPISAIVWFVAMARLYRILRSRHSATYGRLGRPTLFLNNSPQNSLATIQFLLGGKFRQLNDPELKRLGTLMQFLFYAYCAVFIAFVVLFVSTMPSHARETSR